MEIIEKKMEVGQNQYEVISASLLPAPTREKHQYGRKHRNVIPGRSLAKVVICPRPAGCGQSTV